VNIWQYKKSSLIITPKHNSNLVCGGKGPTNPPTQGPLINSQWVGATVHMKTPPSHYIFKKIVDGWANGHMEIDPYFFGKTPIERTTIAMVPSKFTHNQ